MVHKENKQQKKTTLESRIHYPHSRSYATEGQKEDSQELIHSLLKEYVGVNIQELQDDITKKLHENPIIDYSIEHATDLKTAKRIFKIRYLKKMLRLHYGNVSVVADTLDINRKTIHRLIDDDEIQQIRDEMQRPYEIKREAFTTALQSALDNYKEILHPDKLNSIYGRLPELTEELTDEFQINPLPLTDAELAFEKQYIITELKQHDYNLKKTANSLGIRYETLLRKIKKHNIHI